MRASFISDLHQWLLGMDCSEGREESQQIDSNQSGGSCESASQQAACPPLVSDRVEDRRAGEVQRYYGVSNGTDQDVLNRAKRLIPPQGAPSSCVAHNGSARSAKRGAAQAAVRPLTVRFGALRGDDMFYGSDVTY